MNGLSCSVPADSPLAKLLKSQRTWTGPDAKERLRILRNAKSVAIVGASSNPTRSSYFVGTYLLQSTDFRVYFVNPNADTILGQKAYPDLASLPEVPDIVDAIVDVTETGSSLRKNGLRILETLLSSYTELITNAAAYADPQKRAAMEDIALLLRGVIRARGQVLLKLNVAADQLAAVTGMLPAMSSPTVTALANSGMHAVETVVPKRGVNTLIPALRAAGAHDILEVPISKIVE